MKRSHIHAIAAINNAIRACGEDFALEDARTYLRRALAVVAKVGDKRAKKATKADEFAEAAKNKNKEWWKTLVEGAKKAAENALNQPTQSEGGSPNH